MRIIFARRVIQDLDIGVSITNGNNYTFFDDSMKCFQWIDSRVLIYYATASLFVSVDKIEEHEDIRHIESVEQNVKRETKDVLLKQIKQRQSFIE